MAKSGFSGKNILINLIVTIVAGFHLLLCGAAAHQSALCSIL